MLSMETLEVQISAIMETVVEAAVSELRRLLDQCPVNVAANEHSSPAVKIEEGWESQETPPEGEQQSLTSQFASFMEAWSKETVEKILMMFRVSLPEAEDVPAAEQSPGLNDENKQKSVKPKETKTTPKKQSKRCHQKKKEGLQSTLRQENDHLYHRVEQQPEETTRASDSESFTKPADAASEGCVSESLSKSKGEEDVVHDGMETLIKTEQTLTNTEETVIKTSGPFKCPSCDKSFSQKRLMDRHFLTHSKPHLCSECGKRFSGLQGLIAHSRRHTGEKLYKCSDCGTEFAYKSSFDRHMRQHNPNKVKTHTCSLCESQFSGVVAFQRHQCNALSKTFVCSLCPETFESRQSLADHENQHSGDRDFVCEMCGECFLSSQSLATHRVTHIQKENCCDALGLGCSHLSVLESHLSKHNGDKLFTCEVCGKGCSNRGALKLHMLTHTGEKLYVCDTCGKRCVHASALQNHLRIHTGRKPGQLPICDLCGKKLSSAVKLKYHMSTHTGEKPYACDKCGKTFRNPSNLKVHTLIHSEDKMYGCNVCGRRFAQANSLRLHRLIHTGEKPYGCNICKRRFIQASSLKLHRCIYMGEKLYNCQVCGEGFLNSCGLMRHQCNHLKKQQGGGLLEKMPDNLSTI